MSSTTNSSHFCTGSETDKNLYLSKAHHQPSAKVVLLSGHFKISSTLTWKTVFFLPTSLNSILHFCFFLLENIAEENWVKKDRGLLLIFWRNIIRNCNDTKEGGCTEGFTYSVDSHGQIAYCFLPSLYMEKAQHAFKPLDVFLEPCHRSDRGRGDRRPAGFC